MSAVAETEAPTADQPLVSQPDASALFMARRSNMRLVLESIRTIRDAEGVAVDKTAGKTIEFREGTLRVPTDGRPVSFTNGEEGDSQAVLARLRKHRLLGDLQEGFWEVDPTAPPLSQDELDRMLSFALELDVDGLREFIRQEETGWAREALLDPARGTLKRVEEALDRSAQELAAATAEAEERGRASAFAAVEAQNVAQGASDEPKQGGKK